MEPTVNRSLAGKVAVITGAATGIGRATALLFARAGARVVLADVRQAELDSTSEEIRKVGEATACLIYAVRPEVCRTCMPGDVECAMARKRHGLPVLA